jgi:5-methylcytosine-specific restriction enzyme subunit McrC
VSIVDLKEWAEATPDSVAELRDVDLGNEVQRKLFTQLRELQMIELQEIRQGLTVRTTSFVGSVRVGSATIRIRPKIDAKGFSTLLGYALGLAQIHFLPEQEIELATRAFQDLLVVRLTSEVRRLISRGLHRQYTRRNEWLSNPRGRILFDVLAAQGAITSASLPCSYHDRDEDILPNRVLRAGLELGAQSAFDSVVRTRALQTAALMRESVGHASLEPNTFKLLARHTGRLTSHYAPAFRLIRLLQAGHGISPIPDGPTIPLPGFLFDMNVLFQEALGRFLREWTPNAQLREQYRLAEVFRYRSEYNPRQKRAPTPRPDYVVMREGRVVAIADAKYRDLWTTDLPRDILYQLSVYALSQPDCKTATILYPTNDATASEARVSINDPVAVAQRAEVVLRPVNLDSFAELLRTPRSAATERGRREFAEYLIYGNRAGVKLRTS